MKAMYYVLFIVALYFFSEVFQEWMVMYGALRAVATGILIAFVCKLVFKTVTKTIIVIAVLIGIIYFLVTTGYIELPAEVMDLLGGLVS